MPHAVADETMGDSFNEADEISRFLGGGLGMGEADGQDQHFDQADKADDAVDYEDISDDDDLPDEEEATHQTNGEGEDGLGQDMYTQVPGSLGGAPPVQPVANGFHEPAESSDGLFAEGDEVNDLFGERLSSPEEERHPQRAPPQQRPGGLALPSKSSLALPTFSAYNQPQRRTSQGSLTSMSPPSFQDRDYSAMSPASMTEEDDDEDDLDPNIALQRRLFKASKMRANGEDIINEPADTDMALFNHLYSGYERSQVPRFTELFPPRYVEYKGKAPIKPPKAVVPTKLSLDLLQDQERNFRAVAAANKAGQESTFNKSFIVLGNGNAAQDESDDDLANSDYDENELVGGVSMQDLALICQDWDIASLASGPEAAELGEEASDGDDWDTLEQARPIKKRKTNLLGAEIPLSLRDFDHSFEEPEHAVAKLAKSVALDLNDPHLLIDEHAPRHKKKLKRVPGELKRDSALSRDIAKRYNISNDQAYDLLKENHQHKVRSTLGSMAVEHSLPAVKLQYPFYRVSLDQKVKRSFHRPSLEFQKGPGREYRFQKPKHIKKKNVRGKEAKEVFAKAEDLSLGDSASLLLLEYSEEAPMTLSNFGMGNRFINYYRKTDADDQTRPKEPIGEAQVLLPQDKSPFANFGHVDKGEIVPTIQNGLYRAPVFAHKPKHTDFVVGVSTTHEKGDFLFLRNVENLHTVGQQFPLAEVPGQHSRKVTDAAKKRLRALSYRIYTKSLTRKDKVLDNATLMPHLPGHDMPQTRSKMREFMKYDRGLGRSEGVNGTWVPNPGQPVPDAETLRSWIRPEDVCLLDSMQVGVQHLSDIGITESKDGDDGGDIEEGANIELQLAPWRATKNFLNACQGKAMLTLHGDGDPTGHGLGFSFVKTSMKGGFQAQGESASDKMDAKKRKDNGGHSYNVAKQQKQYDESIRRIWEQQKESLSNDREHSDDEMEDEPDRSAEYNQSYAHTPRSSMSTPAAFASRHDDDSVSQFSGQSANRPGKKLLITRKGGFDQFGQPLPDFTEEVTNPAVIREYKKRAFSKQLQNQSLAAIVPTGDKDKDHFARLELEKELARIQRNADRREARDRLKARNTAGSPAAAGSPGRSDIDGPASTVNGGTEITPQKGKGRSKDGTARKCANCGQVGHIKTNRKLCPLLNGTMKPEDAGMSGDSSFGAVPAPLTL